MTDQNRKRKALEDKLDDPWISRKYGKGRRKTGKPESSITVFEQEQFPKKCQKCGTTELRCNKCLGGLRKENDGKPCDIPPVKEQDNLISLYRQLSDPRNCSKCGKILGCATCIGELVLQRMEEGWRMDIA